MASFALPVETRIVSRSRKASMLGRGVTAAILLAGLAVTLPRVSCLQPFQDRFL